MKGRRGEGEKGRQKESFSNNTQLKFSFLILFLSLLFFSSCARFSSTQSTNEINIAAASSLSDAFNELGKQFTLQTGARVVFSYGATADLAKQIENGAPYDVFAAADVETIERLKSSSLITENSNSVFARGKLVLWIPPSSKIKIARVEELTNQHVERIAIANPNAAPYGRAAVEALRKLNLWSGVESKIIYSQNVAQAKQYAATGNVDAAFVPASLLKQGEGFQVDVEDNLHAPLDHSIAVIKESKKQDIARQFVEFVLSERGKAILKSYGYK
jgi:molybdate transport system substrate-binding protein